METDQLSEILNQVKTGTVSVDKAADTINSGLYGDLGHTTIDNARESRVGCPEVIYGAGKSDRQILDIISYMSSQGSNILATRVEAETARHITDRYGGKYHPLSRTYTLIQNPPPPVETEIAIVTAGTSDLPAAEEAKITAETMGNPVKLISDVGVAGIHRLFRRLEEIRSAKVIIVAAGMEGALAGVVTGLVDKPVIALPTSVGYGASFNGLSALLGMLNSCSSGMAVVNIDGGFNAGYMASMINRLE